MPRGGRRVGAGKKPSADPVREVKRQFAAIDGGAGRVGATRPAPPAGVVKPADLSASASAVWDRLAEHATHAQTLVPQTAETFGLLCRTLVQLEEIRARIESEGYMLTTITDQGERTIAHPLLTQERGFLQRVDALLARFGLAPFGKPVPASGVGAGPKPVNPWTDVMGSR